VEGAERECRALGGEERLIEGWKPHEGELRPLTFDYEVPSQ
jgi:hypothetical protein